MGARMTATLTMARATAATSEVSSLVASPKLSRRFEADICFWRGADVDQFRLVARTDILSGPQ
jgi:hypothetical protein